MRLPLITLLLSIGLIACSADAQMDQSGHNTLTQQEIDEGWTLLFDGESTEHWRGYNRDYFPDEAWGVEGEALVLYPIEGENADIITVEKYQDFEFTAEWMIEEGGNSGIFHHVIEQPDYGQAWSGPEMQILDNEAYPDLDDMQLAGALYDIKPADPQNTRPHGEWNTIRIVSQGPHMEYWQNGEKVVEFERWTAEWYDMVRDTKFECHPAFGNAPKGHIGLQDHGDVVSFRNLKVRQLD